MPWFQRPNRLSLPQSPYPLLKLLEEFFGGILVTDFYSAYNLVTCPKQKCLVSRRAGIAGDSGDGGEEPGVWQKLVRPPA